LRLAGVLPVRRGRWDFSAARVCSTTISGDIPASGIRKALVELFRILDQRLEQRDKYLAGDNPALAAFPYVNGGLFSDENIEIPPFMTS